MPTFGGDTKKAKRVQLAVAGVTVCCPHCDEAQPAPDGSGSHLWEPHHLEQMRDKRLGTHQGPDGRTWRYCTSCQQPFYFPSVITSVRMP